MGESIRYSRIPADALERWKVVRDVCTGDQALRSDDYLPFLNKIDQTQGNIERNRAYRQRAVLYTATSFTRDGLVGLAFRLDPRSDLPPKLAYLLKDADGAGTSLYQQSQSVLGHNVEIGRHGLYTDFSEALARPVIKSYRAEDIINWRYSLEGGKAVLSMVVLREEVEVSDGGYGLVKVNQYRELFLENGVCMCRLWSDGAKEDESPIVKLVMDAQGEEVDALMLRSSGAPLDSIPFDFVGSQNNDATIDDAPLYGLAKVNVAHFRNSADFEDSVFFVGQVQPWISGLDEAWRDHLENPVDEQGRPTGQTMYIGSRSPILLPTNGAFGFAQAQPNMLVKEAMVHKEAQMIALGARLIEAVKANKTATGEDNDREATTSVLSLCVSNVNEAYQSAIARCARYLDMAVTAEQAAGAYKINQDFARVNADPAVVAQMVAAWQTGLAAKQDVRAWLRRVGLIATERTDEAIDKDVSEDGPALGSMGDPADVNDPVDPTKKAAPAGA